jgi:DNA repair protein RecN (Recombination protein N)
MYLARLRIEQLALVEALDVEFPRALVAVTGETGAGKSMILGSLQLLLGQRADAGLVRKGARRAIVEGVFESDSPDDACAARLHAELAAAGIDPADAQPLIIRREVQDTGRSLAHVAGRLVTAKQLAGLAQLLMDIHSQHEQQSLMQRRWQRETVDNFAGAADAATQVRNLYAAWRDAENDYADWLARERELRRQEDLLRYQVNEIRAANPVSGEEEELARRETMLAHAAELAESVALLNSLLDDDEHGLLARAQQAMKASQQVAHRDATAEEWCGMITDVLQRLNDLRSACDAYAARLETDPGELDRVQERLHVLAQLRKKYGDTLDAVLAYGDEAAQQLERIGSYEERLTTLRATADRLQAELDAACGKLSRARAAAAPKLNVQVTAELARLGMPAARFFAQLTQLEEPSASGREEIEFMVATNSGEDPRPLAKIASGGELSRLMLALKCVAMRRDDVPILMFDEIDAGISGAVARAVAERLQRLGDTHQVFVITHMPQIACRATTHFTVDKRTMGARTSVGMRLLGGDDRADELSRMLGGDSDLARAHARELLEHAAIAPRAAATPPPSRRVTSKIRTTT